jgi:GntR family transcriptional repressor for pyruvate dehydrogenase complex
MAKNLFSPVKAARISEEIEDQIRGAILSGKVKPGNRLPSENELCNVFNTSRVTVREALRTLERDGLLRIKSGVKGGSYVRELNISPAVRYGGHLLRFKKITMDDLTEARLVIEPEIGKMAALRATQNDIDLMEEALREQRRRLKKPIRSTETNIKFHRIISASCKNPVLSFLNDTFLTLLQEKVSKLSFDLDERHLIMEQHLRIFESIKAKEPSEAYLTLREHILTVKKAMK